MGNLKYWSKRILVILDKMAVFGVPTHHDGGLVIVRVDLIGDFVLWLDVAKEYRRLFPNQKLTLIANPVWADFAKILPYWDDVWSIDLRRFTRNLWYRWMMLRKIRTAGFEIAVQPTFSRVFLHGDSIIGATGAAQRIGSIGNLSNTTDKEKTQADLYYTRLINTNSKDMTELERNAEFTGYLGDQVILANIPKLPPLPSLPAQLQFTEPYWVIFPGASKRNKQWPAENFALLQHQIRQRYGWQCLLCGSSSEKELCQLVADQGGVGAVNLAGLTSLAEVAELIRGAKLLVANDTSAIHIGAAVETPTVCITGGGQYGRFLPYPESVKGLKPWVAVNKMPCFQCNWFCTQTTELDGPVPCISTISVDAVLDLANQAVGFCSATVSQS